MVVVVLLAVVAIVADRVNPDATMPGWPPVFTCEVVALLLFLVFWVVQSIQRWNDDLVGSTSAA
jgi:hypothetical protein